MVGLGGLFGWWWHWCEGRCLLCCRGGGNLARREGGRVLRMYTVLLGGGFLGVSCVGWLLATDWRGFLLWEKEIIEQGV